MPYIKVCDPEFAELERWATAVSVSAYSRVAGARPRAVIQPTTATESTFRRNQAPAMSAESPRASPENGHDGSPHGSQLLVTGTATRLPVSFAIEDGRMSSNPARPAGSCHSIRPVQVVGLLDGATNPETGRIQWQ